MINSSLPGVELNNTQVRYARGSGKPGRFLAWVSWGYPALVAAVWIFTVQGGDRWWPATVALYAPRWPVLIPLLALIPAALLSNRLLLIPLLAGGLMAAGPFMGLHLPHYRTAASGDSVVRILTCNINAGGFNRKHFADLLHNSNADIVALQECPRDPGVSLPPGWHSVREGELIIWSRYPLERGTMMQALHPPHAWPRTCLLTCTVQTPEGALTFCTVHLPSPRYGLTEALDRKTILNPSRSGVLEQETLHRQLTAREAARQIASLPGPVVIAGDFNMPADSPLYREAWGGYQNAFSQEGFGYGWTQRTVLRGIPIGLRIDHTLIGAGLGIVLSRVGPDIGSDHLPLITDIKRPSAGKAMSWWSW